MKAYYLGGDASKGYCDFVLLDENKNVVEENFQLDDCHKGHQKLFQILMEFFSRNRDGIIYAGLESTGGYENNWYELLWKLQGSYAIKVARLNPYGVKYHKRASLERIETDKISARKIAEYLIAYADKVEYTKEDRLGGVRRYWKYIGMLKKQKSQIKTDLKIQLYVSFPEILPYCTGSMAQWVLLLLQKYPTAQCLTQASVKELCQIPYMGKERAIELISQARKSVASMKDGSMEQMIISMATLILHLHQKIEEEEKLMISSYNFPEIEILCSFKGIRQYSAFGLLVEIGTWERYDSVKKLASFFGLHPSFRESGDGKWGSHMSKKGRKEPRRILFNVAKSAIVHNEMIKELYEGYVARGKNKMVALVIIMHKILRILYGMLKNNTKYDPAVDIQNRKRSVMKKEAVTSRLEKARRYQDYDQKAPISRRQIKKRNKREHEMKQEVIDPHRLKESEYSHCLTPLILHDEDF